MESMTPPPPDDELPPPPTDIESEKQNFPPIKSRRPSPMAALRRASAIFEKDLRTMAKHGLVSAIILLVFLGIVFYIMSFAMQQSMMMKFDGGGDGGDGGKSIGPLPGTSDRIPPVASMNVGASPILAGTTVQLDASASTDDQGIIFYLWNFQDGGRDVQLYGRTVSYTFAAEGKYNISLMVVDPAWNMADANATIVVNHSGSDAEPPNAIAGDSQNVPVGTLVRFNGSNSSDNVGVVNWTWTFKDFDWKIERTLYGVTPAYRFDNAGNYWIQLTVRDAAGNTGQGGTNVQVNSMGGGYIPNVEISGPQTVNVGDTVSLGAILRQSNVSVQSYMWFITQNSTTIQRTGSNTTFVAAEQGVYSVVLAARDTFGNVGSSESMVIVVPADVNPNEITWESTPFGFEMPFNLLTYAYGIALLSSVIYVGGFFAKGFTHEISKGTIKVLFFGPISVTTMIFSKILYPTVVGPIFIFPLVLLSLSRFGHPAGEVLTITLVAYAFSVVTMVAAAYGSCMIYALTKRMSLKPSIVSRMFLYFSLLGTFTVGAWASFLMDTWTVSDRWSSLWDGASGITTLSPFHQGGVILSHMMLGTSQMPNLVMFAIPAALIAGGVLASRKLYSDIFSRE